VWAFFWASQRFGEQYCAADAEEIEAKTELL
jgi:hypothetical protein